MNKSQLITLQQHVGTLPDAVWGPKSIAATQRHLRALMPSPNPWPTQALVRSGRSVFGRAGERGGYTPPMKSFPTPYPIFLYGNRAEPVRRISCHVLVADSLERVLVDLRDRHGDHISEWGMDRYYGCYNPRNVRGGNATSMHAWALAVDFDATRNGNTTHWPTRSQMPIYVMECFAREGWLPAGAFWHRDAMHFQVPR